MLGNQEQQERILVAFAIGAAAAIHVSIALSQILLAVCILLSLLFRGKLFFPRIWIPLAAFFFWTALADVFSPDPWGGRAQLKKFFVFFLIPVVYGAFRERIEKAGALLAAWLTAATASGLLGLYQFAEKYRHARQTGEDFYVTYVGHRITGFESHWMTFGALQLSVLSLLAAHFFFARRRWRLPVYAACGVVLFAAIVLGETRSIWLATMAAIVYLIWMWKPKMLAAVPLVAALTYFASPAATRERFQSIVSPHGETDSNRHRAVTFRTGMEMVKAHPWFGIGPEQIGRQFDRYVPADIHRPLPVGYYGHLHNIYVQYAAERGLPGLVLLVWLVVWTLLDIARTIRALGRRPSTELFVLHGGAAVIIGILVGGVFEYNLGDSEVLMMFASVVGLSYAAANAVTRPVSRPAPEEFRSEANPAPDGRLLSLRQ